MAAVKIVHRLSSAKLKPSFQQHYYARKRANLPEVPYPSHTVLSSRVHELTILIETETSDILGQTLKHIHLVDRIM